MGSYLEIEHIFGWDIRPTLFTCRNIVDRCFYICALHHVADDGKLWCVGAKVAYPDLICLYGEGKSTAYTMLAGSDWYGWVVSDPEYPLDRFRKTEMNEEEKRDIKVEDYFGTETVHGNFWFDGRKNERRFELSITTKVGEENSERYLNLIISGLSQVAVSVDGETKTITVTGTEDSTLWGWEYPRNKAEHYHDGFDCLEMRLRNMFWMCGDDFTFTKHKDTVIVIIPKDTPIELEVSADNKVSIDYDMDNYESLLNLRTGEPLNREEETNEPK